MNGPEHTNSQSDALGRIIPDPLLNLRVVRVRGEMTTSYKFLKLFIGIFFTPNLAEMSLVVQI